jgi:hypothetical protein
MTYSFCTSNVNSEVKCNVQKRDSISESLGLCSTLTRQIARRNFSGCKWDLKVCDDGILKKLLICWTLSIVFFLYFYLFKNNVSVTGHCLCPQVKKKKPAPLDPLVRAITWGPTPVSETLYLNKNRTMNNAQKASNCI